VAPAKWKILISITLIVVDRSEARIAPMTREAIARCIASPPPPPPLLHERKKSRSEDAHSHEERHTHASRRIAISPSDPASDGSAGRRVADGCATGADEIARDKGRHADFHSFRRDSRAIRRQLDTSTEIPACARARDRAIAARHATCSHIHERALARGHPHTSAHARTHAYTHRVD